LFAGLLLLGLSPALRAQSIRWEPSSGTLAVGQVSELTLVCDDCEPKDTPAPPSVPGLTLEVRGRSQRISMVNFSVAKTLLYTFAARLDLRQSVEIPAFDVETDKGRLHVPAAHFDPGNATVGQSNVNLESVANSRFTLPGPTVWVGEVFPLTYTLSVVQRYYQGHSPAIDWSATPLAIEDWSQSQRLATTLNGETGIAIVTRTRAYAPAPGTVKLQPATQLLNLATGYSNFGLFQSPVLQQYSITSNQPELVVRPLPRPAPAAFNGAVGQFQLESKVVPERANVGEPITWTLVLSGTGNWPDLPGLPPRDVSKDFQVVQPQAKRTVAEGKIFDATLSEDVVLMPTRTGRYTLGPVAFTYFDPKSGSYKTLTTEKVTITVTDTSAPPAANEKSAPSAEAPTSPLSALRSPLSPPPGPPAALPGDPLPGAASALTPFSLQSLLTLGLLSAVALPLSFWLFLALRRAWATDPMKPQREARRRLQATLEALSAQTPASPPSPTIRGLLLAWQRDTAVLWEIAHAAPSALALLGQTRNSKLVPRPQADSMTTRNPAQAEVWAQLWREADRALYGAQCVLPQDWGARAELALEAKPAKSFSPATLFLPRNLLPFFCLAVLFGLALPTLRADPIADYRKGDFAAAEKAWLAVIAKHPTDWRARHNLGLALIQQERPAEAAAQWTAAFVQHPDDPTIQRDFVLGCDKAGYTPAVLAVFAQSGPVQDLARLASPAEWQLGLVAAGLLVAAAFGLWLLVGYGRRARWLKPAAWSLLVLALLLTTAAAVSLHAYGPAADARAALAWRHSALRSIPTEADTTQKTTPLAAGSLAVVDKVFLGWVRLSFDNGQTGWVRQEEVVMLWQ
jgi:tetratricopeptide (TPR) repeat protein